MINIKKLKDNRKAPTPPYQRKIAKWSHIVMISAGGLGTLALSCVSLGIPAIVGTILLGVSGAAKVVAELNLQKVYTDLPEGHTDNEK